MTSFPAFARNVLFPISMHAHLDFFYVGPADASYEHGADWLNALPGLKAKTLYAPTLRWLEEQHSSAPLAEFVNLSEASKSAARLPTATFNLQDNTCSTNPPHQVKTFLVQALQGRECLKLISQAEQVERARSPSHTGYMAILRARVDFLALRPVEMLSALLPQPTSPALGSADASCKELGGTMGGHKLGPTVEGAFWPFSRCPKNATRRGWHHDFALLGTRRAMGEILSAVDGLDMRTLASVDDWGCNPLHAGFDRLFKALPGATCRIPSSGGVVGVGSVRGSVASKCYYVDQEHPELLNGLPQPSLASAGEGAAEVANICLGLWEARDGRLPGNGTACEPRGGWDGDFREDASPWDATSSTPNKLG